MSKPLTIKAWAIKHKERPEGRFVLDVWDRCTKAQVRDVLRYDYHDWQKPSIVRVTIKESPHD